MAPFYISLCEQLKWSLDQELLQQMQEANEEKLKELQEKLKDAEENFGDNEVREACLARAQFFSEIGFKVHKSRSSLLSSIFAYHTSRKKLLKHIALQQKKPSLLDKD